MSPNPEHPGPKQPLAAGERIQLTRWVNLWCLYCSYNLNCSELLPDRLLERQSSAFVVTMPGWLGQNLSILHGTGHLTVHSTRSSSFIFTSHRVARQFCTAMSILLFSLIHILPMPMSVLEEYSLVFFFFFVLLLDL